MDASGLWVLVDEFGKVSKTKGIPADTPLPEIPGEWKGHGAEVAKQSREAYNSCLRQCNTRIIGEGWEDSTTWTDEKRKAVIECHRKCDKYRQRQVWSKGSKMYDQFVEDFEGLPNRADAAWWKHGNFCGAGQAAGNDAPTDALDACCKAHDDCFGAKDGPGDPLDADTFFKLRATARQLERAIHCNRILKECVRGVGCNAGSPGDRIAGQVCSFFDVWELLYSVKGLVTRIF